MSDGVIKDLSSEVVVIKKLYPNTWLVEDDYMSIDVYVTSLLINTFKITSKSFH